MIDFDLDKYPIQLKTDSEIGSGDIINICFYISSETHVSNWRTVGHIVIEFSNPMRHRVYYCSDERIDFSVPEGQNKVWKITKTSRRLRISCDSVVVIDVEFDQVPQ